MGIHELLYKGEQRALRLVLWHLIPEGCITRVYTKTVIGFFKDPLDAYIILYFETLSPQSRGSSPVKDQPRVIPIGNLCLLSKHKGQNGTTQEPSNQTGLGTVAGAIFPNHNS